MTKSEQPITRDHDTQSRNASGTCSALIRVHQHSFVPFIKLLFKEGATDTKCSRNITKRFERLKPFASEPFGNKRLGEC